MGQYKQTLKSLYFIIVIIIIYFILQPLITEALGTLTKTAKRKKEIILNKGNTTIKPR